MNECLLCSRDMKKSKDIFGNSCIKNIYSFLNLKMPKNLKLREDTLNKYVMRITSSNSLSRNQKNLLVDRYLSYKYLNKILYGNLDKLKSQINEDIQNMDKINEYDELKSTKSMSLNQAYNLYRKVNKFQEEIVKIKEHNFKDKESVKLLISSFGFIFNLNKNKNQYEKSVFKAMQYAFWQTVIEVGRTYANFDISADLLQHSLESKPSNLLISNGKIIEEIIKDKNFKKCISNIVEKYGSNNNEFIFDSSTDKYFPLAFNESDLYFSLNKVYLFVKGKKENGKWNLEIKLHDRYDYSDPKNVIKYYNDTNSISKSIFSSTLYNFAYLSVKANVMKEYNIDILFKINSDFEVIIQ